MNQFSLLIRMKKKTNVFSLTKIFKIVFAYGYKDYYKIAQKMSAKKTICDGFGNAEENNL